MKSKRIGPSFLGIGSLCAILLLSYQPAYAEGAPSEDVTEIGIEELPPVLIPDEPRVIPQDPSMGTFAAEGETCTGEGDIRTCVELGTDPVEIPAGSAGVGTFAIQPEPEWCFGPGSVNQFQGTRSQLCAALSGSYRHMQYVNGVPTTELGRMNFTVYHYEYTSYSDTVWASQIRVVPTSITGTAAGTTISATVTCNGSACTPGTQSFPTQSPGVGGSASGESYWHWSGAPGQVATGRPAWTIGLKAPSAGNTAQIDIHAQNVRCDNALPGSGPGCVVPSIQPWIVYELASWPEFGAHVQQAQASGLKGSLYTNQPLHRLTDTVARDHNRAIACPASLPRPSGKSCDEYPFASTHEGAALSGGGPRTFSWCQVSLPGAPSTGSSGYSVCMINDLENTYAGSALNTYLYGPQRVLEGEPFYVDIW